MTAKRTIDDLKQIIHKWDLIKCPQIAIAQPSVIKTLKEQIPDIEEKIVLKEADYVDPDKIIVIERAELEKWSFDSLGYLGLEVANDKRTEV